MALFPCGRLYGEKLAVEAISSFGEGLSNGAAIYPASY
jgi:hypothetical protein